MEIKEPPKQALFANPAFSNNNGGIQATISGSDVITSDKTMNIEKQDPLFEIIEGCISGDRKCQQKMYETLYGKMLGVCLRYAKDRDDAVDILQDGFIKMFANIKLFGSSGSFEGWVRRIMVNTAIDYYRKNKKSPVIANSEYVDRSSEEIEDETNEDEYNAISPNEILEAVQQLSPAYRTIFNMYVVDEYTHKEIAEQLGINEGTSKSNYAKAKANLKKVLAKKIRNYSTH